MITDVPFLRLPAEIRIMIYNHLWDVSPCSPMPHEFRTGWTIRVGPESELKYPPLILRMDPRIQEEFMAELCREFGTEYALEFGARYRFVSIPHSTLWAVERHNPGFEPENIWTPRTCRLPLFPQLLRRCHVTLKLCDEVKDPTKHVQDFYMDRLGEGFGNILLALHQTPQLEELTCSVFLCEYHNPRTFGPLFDVLLHEMAQKIHHVKLRAMFGPSRYVRKWVGGKETPRLDIYLRVEAQWRLTKIGYWDHFSNTVRSESSSTPPSPPLFQILAGLVVFHLLCCLLDFLGVGTVYLSWTSISLFISLLVLIVSTICTFQ